MSRPADILLSDELRSLQLYLSLQFTSDEIRLSRPEEDQPYDMLIEPPAEIVATARGTYMTEHTMPLVVQRWCNCYNDALEMTERLVRAFRIGVTPGARSRVPVWKWPLSGTVDPDVDIPDRFLRVGRDGLEARILPAEKIGMFVAICDVVLMGWRITHPYTDQYVETVDFTYEEPE